MTSPPDTEAPRSAGTEQGAGSEAGGHSWGRYSANPAGFIPPQLIYSAPAWKDDLIHDVRGARRLRIRCSGNVYYLPAPIAGYRLTQAADGWLLHIVARRGSKLLLGGFEERGEAADALASVAADHRRPILPDAYLRGAA